MLARMSVLKAISIPLISISRVWEQWWPDVQAFGFGTRGVVFKPSFATTVSEICYLLLPGHDMTEILLKRRKSMSRRNFNLITSNFELWFFEFIPCGVTFRLIPISIFDLEEVALKVKDLWKETVTMVAHQI